MREAREGLGGHAYEAGGDYIIFISLVTAQAGRR